MVLQFIDQNASGIGRADRRLIRSHVMQGKNKGKQRRSTKKQNNGIEPKGLIGASRLGLTIPKPIVWGDLCLTSFPEQLDSKSMALMHRWFFDISDALFPPQFCVKFNIIQSIWVNCILADEAYFHSTLAISASYVNFFQRRSAISSTTLHHICKAYSLVNVKLSGESCVSDSAIAAVVSLAIYQQVHHQPATGLVHLQGLCQMIELRGGIANLMQQNRPLALKPLRLDLELAIQNGTRTIFHSDEVPVRQTLALSSFATDQLPIFASWVPPIMRDLIAFSRLLNQADKNEIPKLNPLDYTETLISLLYRLVKIPHSRQSPIKPKIGGVCADVTNLSMLSFMTTLLPEYTRDGPSCPLLSDNLRQDIKELCSIRPEPEEHKSPLLLWILFMSGISVLNPKYHPWILPLIAQTCEGLQLNEWADVQGQLRLFPWINALHEAPSHRIWEDIQVSSKRSWDITSGELK